MEPQSNRTACPGCGAVAASLSRFCSACGLLLDPSAPEAASPRGKWHHNVWFVLVMLFLVLGPFGLPLVWKNPRFSPSVKWMLTLLTFVYTAWLLVVTMNAAQTALRSVHQFNSTLSF